MNYSFTKASDISSFVLEESPMFIILTCLICNWSLTVKEVVKFTRFVEKNDVQWGDFPLPLPFTLPNHHPQVIRVNRMLQFSLCLCRCPIPFFEYFNLRPIKITSFMEEPFYTSFWLFLKYCEYSLISGIINPHFLVLILIQVDSLTFFPIQLPILMGMRTLFVMRTLYSVA